jgi:hypothetical protein
MTRAKFLNFGPKEFDCAMEMNSAYEMDIIKKRYQDSGFLKI